MSSLRASQELFRFSRPFRGLVSFDSKGVMQGNALKLRVEMKFGNFGAEKMFPGCS